MRAWHSCLANSRQGITDEHIYDSTSSVEGSHQHCTCRLFANFPDHLRFASAGRETQGVDRSIGVLRGDDRQELAFISNMQRIEPEQLARAADGIAHRNLVLKKTHAQSAIAR